MKKSSVCKILEDFGNSSHPGDRRKYHTVMKDLLEYIKNVINICERMKIGVDDATKENLEFVEKRFNEYKLYPKLKK